MGVVLNYFARKWFLRRPWANLARFLRDHSHFWVFGWTYLRAPFWCLFSCSFLLSIDIHLLSIDFPLNPKGNQRISKFWNSCACPCIFLSEYICFFCFAFDTLIVFPFPCLCFWQGGMDYGSTLGLKLARFWREACAEVGWKTLSLWQDCYSLLSYMFVHLRKGLSTWTAWDSQWYKHKVDVE